MYSKLHTVGKVFATVVILTAAIGGTWYYVLRDARPAPTSQAQNIVADPFRYMSIPPQVVDDSTRELFEQKIEGAKAMYEAGPDDVTTWVAIGNLYRLFKQPEYAVVAYQKTIEIDPSNLVGYRNIAEVYAMDLQKFDQASTYYRLAVNRNLADPTLYLSYGFLLEKNLHQPEEAEKIYLDGLQKTRNDRDIMLNLVELYKRLGNDEKYQEYGKKLLAAYPSDMMVQEKYKALKSK